MDIQPLHSWALSASEAIALQRRLAGKIRPAPFELVVGMSVAGVDVSYRRFGNLFHAGVVVLSYPDLEPLATAVATLENPFPYIPGLLSFRELPVVLEAFRRLEQRPDLVMVDGQGRAHPRRFGLACHLGLWLGLPTLGCAKSRLCGDYDDPAPERGATSLLREEGEELGRVVRTRTGVKPLFVSPGHLIDVTSAERAVLACHGGYRLPAPTRHAHLLANRQRLQVEPG